MHFISEEKSFTRKKLWEEFGSLNTQKDVLE